MTTRRLDTVRQSRRGAAAWRGWRAGLLGLLLCACATETRTAADVRAALAERARLHAAAAQVQVGMSERRVRELMGAPDNIRVAYLPQSRNAAVRAGYSYTYVLDPALSTSSGAPAQVIYAFSNDRVVTKIERRSPTNAYAGTASGAARN